MQTNNTSDKPKAVPFIIHSTSGLDISVEPLQDDMIGIRIVEAKHEEQQAQPQEEHKQEEEQQAQPVKKEKRAQAKLQEEQHGEVEEWQMQAPPDVPEQFRKIDWRKIDERDLQRTADFLLALVKDRKLQHKRYKKHEEKAEEHGGFRVGQKVLVKTAPIKKYEGKIGEILDLKRVKALVSVEGIGVVLLHLTDLRKQQNN